MPAIASKHKFSVWNNSSRREKEFANARLAILKRAKAVVLLPIIAGAAAWGIVSLIPNRYASMAVIQIEPGQGAPSATDGRRVDAWSGRSLCAVS